MEMRSLTRSLLRARPTSLYTTTAPSSILGGQFLANQRFASSSSSSSSSTTTSRGPRSQNKPSPSDSGASDFDQILDKLNINNAAPKSQNPYASTTPGATQQRTGGDGSNSSNNDGAFAVSRALNAATSPVVPLRKVALKLGPSLGRQVYVEPERGMDLASSLRVLQSTCNQNKVKQDTYSQKYHVRRGQVRKNLRVQRWRKLFKYSFQRTVARIDRMRAQGW